MRILRIQLRATFKPTQGVNFESEEMRRQFFQEVDALLPELADLSRKRISAYFPQDYCVFVRILLQPEGDAARIIVWVDDPTIRWPAGMLARRAWKLSVPVLAHALSETFDEKIRGVQLSIDRNNARVASFAPIRSFSDPLVLAVMVFLLTSLFWQFGVPLLLQRMSSGHAP